MEEIAKKDWEYTLFRTEDGAFILSVLCGRSAVYEVRIKLTETEANAFSNQGMEYLDSLAGEIRSAPSSFQERAI